MAITAVLVVEAQAANTPPAMIVPGQFNVSATGAFTYTVPIAVPPGTAGMAPALSLDYSSQSGDGLEGLGWTLSGLPSIGRCPQTIAEDGVHRGVNYNSSDRFCMDGQRLVSVVGGYGNNHTIYRTEIEGFSKIESFCTSPCSNGPMYFKVWTKSGQIMEFGNSTDSRIYPVKADGSGLMSVVRTWAVNKISDTEGNYLTVSYTNNTSNGEVRPSEIDYTANDSAHLAPFASVTFTYGITRADPILFYQAGAVQKTTVLLTSIKTYVGAAVVSNYKLGYATAANGTEHDELTSVTQCDSGSNCLKPTTFGWQGSGGTLTVHAVANGIAQSTTPNNLGWIDAADFNADGITDVVYGPGLGVTSGCGAGLGPDYTTQGYQSYYTYWYFEDGTYQNRPSRGSSCFKFQPNTRGLGALTLPDFDGNGFADLIVGQTVSATTDQWFFLQNNTEGRLDQVNVLNQPGYLGDFNGDGRTDLFYAYLPSSNWVDALSDGNGTFEVDTLLSTTNGQGVAIADFDGDGCSDVLQQLASATGTIQFGCRSTSTTETVPDWTNKSVVLGDFNGDGKTDFLVVPTSGSSDATLYLSTGTGLSSGYDISGSSDWYKYAAIAADWNGDGKADLALIAAGATGGYGVGTTHKLLLSTGTGFVQKATIANSNALDTKELPVIADWNNDGAADIWLKKPSGDTQYNFAYVPALMTSVDNGLGIETTVTYDRINKNGVFYAKCADGGYACGDTYPTQGLDGALYAVSAVDSSNGIGGTYKSTYSYGQAKADLHGRGFLGFGSVVIKDLQTGIVQTTNYLTRWPYLGLITSQTKVCPAPTCAAAVTLNFTSNAFKTVQLGTGTDGVARVFVAMTRSVVTANDLDGTALPPAGTIYTYDCDTENGSGVSICADAAPTTASGFGNVTRVKNCQWDVAANNCLSGGWVKTTTNTYANDPAHWYLGRLLTADVRSVVSGSDLTRQTAYTYLNDSGLLNTETVEPESSPDPTLKLTTNYDYDAFGNKTVAATAGCVWASPSNCAAANRHTTTEFNTDLQGRFPTKVTNALNQSETWAYASTNNLAFGVPSSHTGPNGLTTSWSYDSFGRKTQETRPDGNRSTVAYTYCTGLPAGESCPANATFDVIVTPKNAVGVQNGPISVTYYDGLSRAIAVDSEGFDAAGTGCTGGSPCWIRVSTIYDAKGRVQKTSRPYFLSGGTAKWTVFTYDTIGRVTHAAFPNATYTDYAFHGLTTSVTNYQGQTTTTLKNAQGLNASVTDAAGNATSYVYDAFGDLLTVTDPASHVTTNVYDIRGRKKQSTDPDMGVWTYVYDGYGELYSQTDAKAQTVTLTYDALGRVLTRTEPDLTSTWTYDTAAHGIGQLASAATASGYSRSYAYDTLGRPSTVTLTIGGTANAYHTTYNPDGRVSTVDYPSGLTTLNTYTALGYQYQVKDYRAGTAFWTANTRDAELHLLTQTQGNGVATTNSFDANTGLITATSAVHGGVTVASQGYQYDSLGNLKRRTWLDDAGVAVHENACHDNLNRLTSTLVVRTGATDCTGAGAVTVAYDALGNITEKSDVCATANCMAYGSGAGPHAITSITGTYNGVTNPSFSYDANGNMVSGAGRTVTSTSFNMAALITDGANSAALTYDSEHHRITMAATGANAGTTVYLNDPISGAMEEQFTATGASAATSRDYILADGHMVALRSVTPSTAPPAWGDPTTQWGSFTWTASSTAPQVLYFTLDHLGSISVITDSTGAVAERDSYDAWGKRRNADGTAAACGTVSSAVTRGFTGQEMMDSTCLINFNARIYDPGLGRFMSADPTTETVYNLQILNRYSYVGNNPLSLTDPSGLCFLGCFWKQSWFTALVSIAVFFVAPELEGVNLFGASGLIAAASSFNLQAIAILAINGGIGGGLAAAVSGGNILKGALLGAAQAAASFGVGGYLGANVLGPVIGATAGSFAAQGLVGGLMSDIEGGNFGSGFLAAGVGSLAGRFSSGPFSIGKLVASAALGGAASVLGGGKFANGAITGAFAYAASSVGQGDAASDNDTSNDNAPASDATPSSQSAVGSGSSDPLTEEVNTQLGETTGDNSVETVTVVALKDTGAENGCLVALNVCLEHGEKLYDKGKVKEAHQHYLDCRGAMKQCFINDEIIQNNGYFPAGKTYFPPYNLPNGSGGVLSPNGGVVYHQKGVTPIYVPDH